MKLRTIRDADLRGKRVLLRAGLNVPLRGGEVADAFRIRCALPTLRYISEKGARTVLLSHLGRAGESLRPVHQVVSEELRDIRVIFSSAAPGPELIAAQESLRDGDVLFLENIRRDAGEAEASRSFAERLAASGDVFVQDAFADMHRAHASIVTLPELLPSYAGFLVVEELEHLSAALAPTRPSVAVVGGAKFETKEPLLGKLLQSYDRVLLGGAIVNDCFLAKGFEIGTSLTSGMALAAHICEHEKLRTPSDIRVFEENASRIISPDSVRRGERIADIGPETLKEWVASVSEASFVLWNGPLGIYERGFNTGTETMAQAIAHSSAHAVVGGGDTIAAICKQDFDTSRVFLSTGGGAMLQFLADGTLPGLVPLVD